jgi:hypothetical protein
LIGEKLSEEGVINQFMTSYRCEVCGQLYVEDDINILGHVDKMWIIQVSCASCHSQSLLAALMDENKENESAKIEELSDLMESELKLFENMVITADDVLDMHNYLSGFQGTISQLLK